MEKSARTTTHVEGAIASNASESEITPAPNFQQQEVTGTVTLLLGNETVLLPTPSPDPKDPLNLPTWRKWAIIVLVSAFSCSSVVLASGLGAIFTAVEASYPGQARRATDLLTYPTLFMGIGNLIGMPLIGVIGRRPLFLASILLLTVSAIWCAKSGSLGSHIAGRDIMSLAAGQSEALAPMMVQEIHFLHERGRKLAWFIFIQNLTVAVLFFSSTYMVSSWGWRWWYGFFAIFNGVVLLLAFFLVSETAYNRPDDAPTGEVHLRMNKKGDLEESGEVEKIVRVTTKQGVVLEPERFGERTWRHDLKLGRIHSSWRQIPTFYYDSLKGLCHPILFWLLLLNGSFLGIYVFQASTFASVLLPPPYGLSFNSLGYVQGAQIFACIVFLPLLGYGSDWTIRWMSRRNGGMYKPEYRLLVLGVPAISGVICAITYGQAAAFPTKYSWASVAISYTIIWFSFLGANIVGITYGVDSFPLKAGPVLLVICAGRGFISFGLSYSILPAVKALGYNGAMGLEGGIAAGITAIAIPMYFFGPAFRRLGQRYYGFGASKSHLEKGDHF